MPIAPFQGFSFDGDLPRRGIDDSVLNGETGAGHEGFVDGVIL